MTFSSTAQTAAATLRPLVIYRNPQPLQAPIHADWRLKGGDAAFAAALPYVPIVVSELASVARCYPVVFAAVDLQPTAILGLERVNLFVSDGRWETDCYVPAFVRRYPFGFVATANPEGYVLAIDAGSDRIVQDGTEGEPLFENSQATELTKQALSFCSAFQADVTSTRAFTEALKAQDLLIDRRADATLPDGRKLGLEGFQIVDADKFAKLGNEVVLDWHKKGWLALVQFHLASLERFSALLARQSARAALTPASQPDSATASGKTQSDAKKG